MSSQSNRTARFFVGHYTYSPIDFSFRRLKSILHEIWRLTKITLSILEGPLLKDLLRSELLDEQFKVEEVSQHLNLKWREIDEGIELQQKLLEMFDELQKKLNEKTDEKLQENLFEKLNYKLQKL
ncbi:hypothetical protein SDJN02_24407, partial [Cucurbita argyrosperma subsp. argyrosperma]